MSESRHRRCLVLRGDPPETARRARRRLDALDPERVLWVGGDAEKSGPFEPVRPGDVRNLLGRSFEAVVLNVHRQLDPDLLGRCHGFVWGGGTVVLRMPPVGDRPSGEREGLAAYPYEPSDVGTRFYDRFDRLLRSAELPEPDAIRPLDRTVEGTDEQYELVDHLVELLADDETVRISVTADRGRGKSSAVGMALRSLLDRYDDARVAVTAGAVDAAAEVFRFAVGEPEPPEDGPVQFVDATALAAGEGTFDAVVADEAAQLPVPILRQMTRRHGGADFVFATTTHGYEGTGRGFTIRFLDWLDDQDPRHERFELEEPIRWGPDDPVESFVFEALLLDAEPAELEAPPSVDEVEHVQFDRDELVADERLLRELFGLLVRAHYRTTPGDLRRMLDAPNLTLHGLLHDGSVVAATWVAEEGGLSDELCEDLYRGRQRLLGHALPETFVTNLGHRDAGKLEMRRSVRIAVHPAYRRRGLGTELVERVHDSYDPDLFGTLFGATPGLLAFRRSVGYEVVRVGSSWGRRAGEPSVAMMRSVSDRAETLFETLREELARKWPLQLELKKADRALLLEEDLERELGRNLPESGPLPEARRREVLCHYAHGPRTYESAAHVVEPFVEEHADRLDVLHADERRVVEARVRDRCSWEETEGRSGMPSMRAVMRGLRRGVRRLVEETAPESADDFGWGDE